MAVEPQINGYHVHFEVELSAKVNAVWKALTSRIDKWWPEHFYSSPTTKAFVVEEEVGGRVYEDAGKGAGVEWGRVIVFQPSHKMIWTGDHFGGKGKNYGRYYLTLMLVETDSGVTLQVEDSGYGMLSPEMPKNLESGWSELFGQHLKAYLES